MNRRPVSGSSAGAEAPGSARSAVAPHPVVSSAAAATSAALNLSRLNIIIPSSRGLDGRAWCAQQAIAGGRDDSVIANRALSACGHDGRCGFNGRTGIAAATSLDATETNSLPAEGARREEPCGSGCGLRLLDLLMFPARVKLREQILDQDRTDTPLTGLAITSAHGVGAKVRTNYGPRRRNSAHLNGQPWSPASSGSRSTTVEARSGGQGVAS